MVEAITLIRRWDLTALEVQLIEDKVIRFVEYYEKTMYKYSPKRLGACRATIHYLLHITQSISDCGPSPIYWQFPCERMCGLLTQKVKSRSAANRNLSLGLLYATQFQLLQLLYPKIRYTESQLDLMDEGDMALEDIPPRQTIGSSATGNVLLNLEYNDLTQLVQHERQYISTPRHLLKHIAVYHFNRVPPRASKMTPNEQNRLRLFLMNTLDMTH